MKLGTAIPPLNEETSLAASRSFCFLPVLGAWRRRYFDQETRRLHSAYTYTPSSPITV